MGTGPPISYIINKFFAKFPQQTYTQGSTLISPQERITSLYFIEEGIIRSYLISTKGTDITINFFQQGTFIPIAYALNHIKSVYYHEAFTNCTLRAAPAEQVLTFLQENPPILFDLLKRVYRGMEGLLLHKEYLIEGNAQRKLMYVLVMFARRFGVLQKDGTTVIPFSVNEMQLASAAGITRETVSRQIQAFKQENIISYNDSVLCINNLALLEEIINGAREMF